MHDTAKSVFSRPPSSFGSSTSLTSAPFRIDLSGSNQLPDYSDDESSDSDYNQPIKRDGPGFIIHSVCPSSPLLSTPFKKEFKKFKKLR
ncbi:hypothetical protein GEMRC1_004791 [Eukaryota sp. GEM-RC1]